MKKHEPLKRSLAMVLSMVVALGAMPFPASADILPSDREMEITAFEPLAEETQSQSVPIGTTLSELNLPNRLSAVIATE
ncbi:hypothetical protein, partial [Lacrimispora sp.]|uniref:hypothetical protein n=1 Tax=Lacrimispora sp. TaxID=2719234 RepID=UPI0032E3B007